MRSACAYASHMSRMIQIRNVPDEVHWRQAQGTGCGDEPPGCRRSAAEHAAAGATSTPPVAHAPPARAFDVSFSLQSAGLGKPKHTCAFEAVFAPPPHSQ